MKLVNVKPNDILSKEIALSISVKELISLWGVFGELTPSTFDQLMKSSQADDLVPSSLTDKILNEDNGVHMNIYDDLSEILANILTGEK